MNVCLRPHVFLSRSLERIASALERYAPEGVTVVTDWQDADLSVYPVIGGGDVARIRERNRPYAVVQCCVHSSDWPDPLQWHGFWRGARLVWSYLDLKALSGSADFPFYFAPLGVDTEVFRRKDRPTDRPITLATSGFHDGDEPLQACAEAVRRVHGRMVHLGPDNLNLGPHVTYLWNVTDAKWADTLNRCRFVSGLRKIEGFELPALEGRACGAWPILYDLPCYERWYGRHDAMYVSPSHDLVEQLTTIFRGTDLRLPAPVGSNLDWSHAARGFWERLLA